MKQLLGRLLPRHFSEKIIHWVKLITITGTAQATIQFISLLSGIMVIRILPAHEYGIYTLANTMLGTMTILSDGGISSGVLAQGGKVWQDKEKLGVVLSTGFNLRRKFSIVSLLIAVPVLAYLMRIHNAAWLTIFLIIVSLIPAFFSALSGSLLQIGLTLNQDIKALQKNQVIVSLLRFLLLLVSIFVCPWAFIAILSNGIPQIWGNTRLKRITHEYADLNSKSDESVRKEILVFVKRILPGSIFYCLSGQITIWLISILGTTTSIAKAGALSRLTMVLTTFNIVFSILIVPRFARLKPSKSVLLKKYLYIQFGLVALSVFIILTVKLFSHQLLWVLGNQYAGLDKELILSVSASCLSLIAGCSFMLTNSRAWAINPFLSISLSLGTIILGIVFMNISTLPGVLKFNIFLMLMEVIMYFIYSLIKINRMSIA